MNDQVNDGGCTPNGIEVALHYYYCCAPHPRRHAGAVQDAIAALCTYGIMFESGETGSGYKFTMKGKAWINMICATPFPRTGMIDPRTNEVVVDSR